MEGSTCISVWSTEGKISASSVLGKATNLNSFLILGFYTDTVTRAPCADNLAPRSSKVSTRFMHPQYSSISGIKYSQIRTSWFCWIYSDFLHLQTWNLDSTNWLNLPFNKKKSDNEISNTSAGLELVQSHPTLWQAGYFTSEPKETQKSSCSCIIRKEVGKRF